jgi:two-component system, sensor histidine kinase PhcS
MQKISDRLGSAGLTEAYREFDRVLRVRQSKVGCFLALILMPAGISLDYFVYPHLLGKAFAARIICDLLLAPFFLLLFSRPGQQQIKRIGSIWLALPALSICWMIYASEGALSPYYAGLCLVLLAACLLMPFTAREAALFSIFTFFAYGLACLFHHAAPVAAAGTQAAATVGTLFNNLYFLSLTSTVCITACRYSSMRRFEDFRLRHELDVNNHELAATLKKLQETEVQLVQSEKMNALGKLSAGLLHEVNNPLNFTFMALQIAEQEAEGNQSLTETLKDIGQGMSRIRGVISDLRAFAHPSNPTDREEFALDDALTGALRLTAHELGAIKIDRAGLACGKAVGGKTQVIHVFMNLLVNSAHALLAKKLDREPAITISCAPLGERIQVKLRDNGTGVRAADLPRLFDPFFTTKDVGQGMGLGLSICHTIVENHGGKISIASEEGQWTEVMFDLPTAPAAAAFGASALECEGASDPASGDAEDEIATGLQSHE